MIFIVKSFAVAGLLCWALQCPGIVYSASHRMPKGVDNSLANSGVNATRIPSTTASIPEDTIDEDFPPLGFYIKDVLTTPLEKSNHTDAFQPNNYTKELEYDELINDSQQDNLSWRLNYETLYVNGTHTLTEVVLEKVDGKENASRDAWSRLSDMELEDPNLIPGEFNMYDHDRDSGRHRQRRAVFGTDDRTLVSHVDSKHLPYSAVVRISTGCTGTLISEYHVLTAAHCVHSGLKWNFKDPKDVKVYVLRHQRKVIQIGVDYVKVPRGWTLSRDYRYDYSVIRLRRPHKNQYLGLYEIPVDFSHHMRIQFASFPADKKPLNSVWYSYCKAYCVNHAILNRCDSFFGSSGAGIFGKIRRGQKTERYVMGVFSGSLRIRFGKRKKRRRMNVAIKITEWTMAQIQDWINQPPRNYRPIYSDGTVAKMPVPPGH